MHLDGMPIFLHLEVPFPWALILHNPRLPDYGNFEAWLYMLMRAAGLPRTPQISKVFYFEQMLP